MTRVIVANPIFDLRRAALGSQQEHQPTTSSSQHLQLVGYQQQASSLESESLMLLATSASASHDNTGHVSSALKEEKHDEEEDPLEFEDWDGRSPFWHHCLAGSLAGLAEHGVVYPLDTLKTHIQCATCPNNTANATTTTLKATSKNSTTIISSATSQTPPQTTTTTTTRGLWHTMRQITTDSAATLAQSSLHHQQPIQSSSSLLKNPLGFLRLFRGIQTMLVGCVPAHALYFSSYETVKQAFTTPTPDGSSFKVSPIGALLAGAAATVGHDIIMTPLDTMKQRMQLGHYSNNMSIAFWEMTKQEAGLRVFFRSLPVTLLTNIPYGMIMVGTYELSKDYLHTNYGQPHHHQPSLAICLASSSLGGMMASFWTTPLDRIKTMLQVQQLQPCPVGKTCPTTSTRHEAFEWRQILRRMSLEQGGWTRGYFRGAIPRVLSHTPAVAISWTTYETAKQWLHNISL